MHEEKGSGKEEADCTGKRQPTIWHEKGTSLRGPPFADQLASATVVVKSEAVTTAAAEEQQ